MIDDRHVRSRRCVLRAAALLTGTALGAAALSGPARAQKASKDAMKYRDQPNGEQQCSNCLHFQPPSGCAIVEGTVSPQGWCMAWAKKA